MADVVLFKLARPDFSSFGTYRCFFAVALSLPWPSDFSAPSFSCEASSITTQVLSRSQTHKYVSGKSTFTFHLIKVCTRQDFCGLGATRIPFQYAFHLSQRQPRRWWKVHKTVPANRSPPTSATPLRGQFA